MKANNFAKFDSGRCYASIKVEQL